jgi:phosphoglycolate phosphatase
VSRASIRGPGWIIEGVSAALFDKDGTLVDLHCYWGEIIQRRARAVMARYGCDESRFAPICRAMGLSLDDGRIVAAGPVGLLSREEIIARLVVSLRDMGVAADEETVTRLFVEVHERFLPVVGDFVRPLPGAAGFAAALHEAGVATAVITSDTTANTEASLARLGVASSFDLVLGRDAYPAPKVSGLPARLALEALHVAPADAVCVGDAPMDAEMARQAGCRGTIAVATGQVPRTALQDLTPYHVASLAELQVIREETP